MDKAQGPPDVTKLDFKSPDVWEKIWKLGSKGALYLDYVNPYVYSVFNFINLIVSLYVFFCLFSANNFHSLLPLVLKKYHVVDKGSGFRACANLVQTIRSLDYE